MADIRFRIILGLILVEFIDEYRGWWLFCPIIFITTLLTICSEFVSQVEIIGPSMAPTIPDKTILLWLHLTGQRSHREWISKERLIRRGQVIVFLDHRKFEGEEKSFLIKRITGLPGDLKYDRWGHRRVIPPGYVWVTGDNIENSFDSTSYGPVSETKIEPMMLIFIGKHMNVAVLDYIPDIPFLNLFWDKETQTFWPHERPILESLSESVRNRFQHNLEIMRDLNS